MGTGSAPVLPAPPTTVASGWELHASKRSLIDEAGSLELHDVTASKAPAGATTLPLRRGELQPDSQTGAPTTTETRLSAATEGVLSELRSPVYLNNGAAGGRLEVLVTGAAACSPDTSLVLWQLAGGSWAAALRLAVGASLSATCGGRQVVLSAPAPSALSANPPASVVVPPASALG